MTDHRPPSQDHPDLPPTGPVNTEAVITLSSPGEEATPGPAPARLAVAIILLPLFFIVTFVFAYISSSHAPTPNDLQLTLAGPSETTSQIAAGIESDAGDSFDISRTTDADDAIGQVQDRDAVGALLVQPGPDGTPTVEIVTASAGGRLASSTVQQLGDQVAQQLGTTADDRDVAPTVSEDGAGAGLFFFLVLCTMGAYLSITGVTRGLPKVGRLFKLLVAGAVAVVTPLVSFAAMSLTYSGFGTDFGELTSLMGVGAIYCLVVALLALLFHEVVGGASVFLVVLVCLAFNLPTSGGSTPAAMLPDFWQTINGLWFGSGAMEAFQSIVYFDGRATSSGLTRLLVWLAGTCVALGTVFYLQTRRSGGEHVAIDNGDDAQASNSARP